MPMGEWRDVGQLADRVGAYCWIEHRLFTSLGQWAAQAGGVGGPLVAEAIVFLAQASRGHAESAERWRQRLPVRAGVDQAALVIPPPGALGEVFDRLDAEPDLARRLAGLSQVVLSRLMTTYGEHLGSASVVSEGAVMASLEAAGRRAHREISASRSFWKGLMEGHQGAERASAVLEFVGELERPFGAATGVFPGARPS
jgi:hypothetical protein